MAERPSAPVRFDLSGCPDCGRRVVATPPALPRVPDDIDLRARDYDGLRRVMMEDLAARQPARTTWNPADEEVVIVEAWATVLDELSDMADRGFAEQFPMIARRPASVRWILEMLGIDAAQEAVDQLGIDHDAFAAMSPSLRGAHLDRYWLRNPAAMEAARAAAPGRIREQRRMVTSADHAERMEDHPLVARAAARARWHGTWPQVVVALVLALPDLELDEPMPALSVELTTAIGAIHAGLGVADPAWNASGLTPRMVLTPYLERLRMAGTEVVLEDVVKVRVSVSLSIGIAPDYFRTEVERALRRALGSGPEGLFAPGRLAIGDDLHASDVLEVAIGVEGVDAVCLNRFKVRGDRFADRSGDGVLPLHELEVPVLDPDDTGLRLALHGGQTG